MTQRQVLFTRKQWVGLPLLFGVPVLALFGVFGEQRAEAHAISPVADVHIEFPTRFRYRQVQSLHVSVRNVSGQRIDVLGKRDLTQMSPFELVTLLFIPQLFSRALPRQDYSMTNAVIGATTLFGLVFLTSVASHRSRRFAHFMEAKPTVLVRRGTSIEEHLDRERIAPEDIFSAMHRVGLEQLEQVEWAILEGDGKISIVPGARPGPASQYRPAPATRGGSALESQ
jgi:hypothetical protein